MPPSVVDWPEVPWPPQRTAISSSCARANRIAAATSAAPRGRTTTAGRLSTIPFQT